MTRIGVAAIQVTVPLYEPETSRRRIARAIDAAAREGARLIVVPELAISGYGLQADGLAASAEPLIGPTFESWAALAAAHGGYIAGGFCEREGDRLYNSAMLVGPQGLIGHYRKLHLFDAEKHIFTPGDKGLPVHELPFGRIGLCVCYDLRFVEVVRALALQGADLIAVPTAWVGGFDSIPRDSGGLITQARGAAVQANLSQVFLACASQAGTAGVSRFLGSSLLVDPFGTVLAGPLGADEEATLRAEIDLADAGRARVRSALIRPREDRRTDVYGLAVGGHVL
ncbi:nitrilase-related carbon-nitrogen hydrolase [Ancylobacter sp. SL191]|uniref:nitrilase-related carbon-nitrogen hydrolase n=1 Tax=Ancylobacter sp. SL191 TaxID=2995166 RepID=UPI00227020D8|nr:nitrilase-related carbon-nitrogen hydrolase [Ancylobacter sp. SL191]WAC25604.1 hydratase [Ancylobacter sp. SL191]